MLSLVLLSALALSEAAATPHNKMLAAPLKKAKSNSTRRLNARYDTHSLTVNNGGSFYSVELKIGSQQTNHQFIIDTGSADLYVTTDIWSPSGSSSFTNMSQSQQDCYGGFCVNGYWGKDTFAFGDTKIDQLPFIVVEPEGSVSNEAMVGLGYTGGYSTGGGYSNFPFALKDQGTIEQAAYTLWLNSQESSEGQIVFGGIDTAKYEGDLVTVPIITHQQGDGSTPERPGDISIVVNGLKFDCGNGTVIDVVSDCALGVVLDTGDSIGGLPKPFLHALGAAVGVEWDASIAAYATTTRPSNGNIIFNFSGAEFAIPLGEFWKVAQLNGQDYYKDGQQVYWLDFGEGKDEPEVDSLEVWGDTFLQLFSVTIDLEAQEIGLAKAVRGNISSSNLVSIGTDGIPSATKAPNYSSTSLHTSYTLWNQ